jgi:hypothetical protein
MPRVGHYYSVKISFSGRRGLSQTRLRITSQLCITDGTTLIICITQFLMLECFNQCFSYYSTPKTFINHPYTVRVNRECSIHEVPHKNAEGSIMYNINLL